MKKEERKLSPEKKLLRQKLRLLTAALPAEYCIAADAEILRHVISMPEYKAADTVFCYVGTEREINTRPILARILADGKRLVVPRCEGKGIMNAYRITGDKDLEPGTMGILEPKKSCPKTEPEEISLALIPCMTCSPDGLRLGYGGGYYDRYLLKTGAFRACLVREMLLSEELPREPHDLMMDAVVTERGPVYVSAELSAGGKEKTMEWNLSEAAEERIREAMEEGVTGEEMEILVSKLIPYGLDRKKNVDVAYISFENTREAFMIDDAEESVGRKLTDPEIREVIIAAFGMSMRNEFEIDVCYDSSVSEMCCVRIEGAEDWDETVEDIVAVGCRDMFELPLVSVFPAYEDQNGDLLDELPEDEDPEHFQEVVAAEICFCAGAEPDYENMPEFGDMPAAHSYDYIVPELYSFDDSAEEAEEDDGALDPAEIEDAVMRGVEEADD